MRPQVIQVDVPNCSNVSCCLLLSLGVKKKTHSLLQACSNCSAKRTAATACSSQVLWHFRLPKKFRIAVSVCFQSLDLGVVRRLFAEPKKRTGTGMLEPWDPRILESAVGLILLPLLEDPKVLEESLIKVC